MKQIEKRDSVLTSKQQIERLLRPGSSYFNLNPFEVTILHIVYVSLILLDVTLLDPKVSLINKQIASIIDSYRH